MKGRSQRTPSPAASPVHARFFMAPAAILAGLVVWLALAAPARAQSTEDCLGCHSDPSLQGMREGRRVSVAVDAKKLGGSVHGGMECVQCHQDLAGTELPHAEDVKRVDCGICHDREAREYARNIHGSAAARGDRLAPGCTGCHGSHDVLSKSDPRSATATVNVPLLCGRCHHEGTAVSFQHDIPQDRILENYSESIHGEGLFKKGLTVTAVCTSCHTAHDILPHRDPRSSINPANVARTCTKCHARIEEVHRKVIEGRLWEEEPHKIPVCVDCHSPHKIRQVFYPQGMANRDCLTCHGKKDLTMVREGRAVSLYVDEQAYTASTHSKTACAQCHTQASPSRRRACETIRSRVDCSICHAEVVKTYRTSIHGRLAAKGDPDAPHCLDCHDKHATQSKKIPSSRTFPRNVPGLCATCHRQGERAAVRIVTDLPNPVLSYRESIHGKGLLDSGLVVTATCADCHTPHGELPPSDPNSTVHPSHIADTCGRCHHGIRDIFQASIHWPGRTDTKKKLPTCEDCHSSHQISRTDRADFRFRMMDQCGRCHHDEAATFFDTYHGKVSRLGGAAAAKCYDCHGTHDILPTVDNRSRLSRANVVKTCAQCHPGANRRFAGYLTHATHHDRQKYPYLFAAFWGMTALLVGTLTFALAHTAAWLWRLWRTRAHWRAHAAAPAEGRRYYQRFTSFQRALHLMMLVSFFTLALTGMSLKFSYARWAGVLSALFGGSETMGALHRIGAMTLGVVFVLHLYDLARHRKASGLSWWRFLWNPDTILFKFRDLKELLQSIRWFLGFGPRPHYGRYTYWEKFDYFAVLWGIVVIGSTGLVLWFPEIFTRLLPGWSINVATIIHSDEALLAVGFIFTIHFFNTHFRPDKFPMDPVIFTGRVPLEEMKYDKPREYEEQVAAGTLEANLVDAIPARFERGSRAFGLAALAVGLSLIALIVYAVLFAYR